MLVVAHVALIKKTAKQMATFTDLLSLCINYAHIFFQKNFES